MPDTNPAPTIASIRKIADPRKRFLATRDALSPIKAELAAIGREAVAELREGGMHPVKIAELLGISRQRVLQLTDQAVLVEERTKRLDSRAAELAAELDAVLEARSKVAAATEGA